MYSGVRLAVPARLDRAQVVLRLDVDVGDPVTPEPVEFDYPSLLTGSFRLLGDPLVTVLAEKIVTVVDRGAATTRELDFADVVLLTRRSRAPRLGIQRLSCGHPPPGWPSPHTHMTDASSYQNQSSRQPRERAAMS